MSVVQVKSRVSRICLGIALSIGLVVAYYWEQSPIALRLAEQDSLLTLVKLLLVPGIV
ncbi:hypothetical protein [Pleionea sp. CnH1-48]|uniref:hypothetical protein n=1 Tax=Pleionea sp. CnH1-48 TaxID=2954494 RepID=UPI0020975344|nr:hypothetical protein [Pleionea sp. CnH1-48]MCO7227248.1 hypothetical protein [Pleionea sp. CnH1-48]